MKVIFIIPYFGKLPEWIDLFLLSCKYNPKFNWLILTDDKTKYQLPRNVEIKYTTFEEVRNRIQSHFEFPINLNKPYKLCDFKPTYGLVFQEELKGYDYWGHTDLDVIYGDLSQFLVPNKIGGYPKVQLLGHLTLYKNNDEVNQYFKLETDTISYKDAFTTDRTYHFDEKEGMGGIFDYHKLKQYDIDMVADISMKTTNMTLVHQHLNEKKQVFVWENGKIFGIYLKNKQIKRKEYEYIHFQKRKPKKLIQVNELKENRFLINHEGFITDIDVDRQSIFKYANPSIPEIVVFQWKRIVRYIKWRIEQAK